MNDGDLVDLITRAALEELTPEQCAAIRAAAVESSEVRRACLERIGLEEHLAITLGRPRVSVDDLLDGQRRVVESRFAGRWLAPLLILLLAGIAAAVALGPFGRRVEEVATARPEPVVAAGDEAGEAAADRSGNTADDPRPEAADAVPEPEAAGSPPAGETKPTVPPPAAAAPWAKALATDGPEPTTADLFRIPGLLRALSTPPDRRDLKTWLAAVPGKPLKFGTRNFNGHASHQVVVVEGTCRLVPPLRPGTALRLLLSDPTDLRLVAWAGRVGGLVEMEGPPTGWRWSGSVVTRREIGGPPESRWLASTSDGRGPRCNAGMSSGFIGFTGMLELRHADGMLVLSRGEVRLVEVPMPEPPEEILFEGTLPIGGIELVRAVVPPPLPPAPPTTENWRPADVAWEGNGAVTLEKRADGGIRLAQRDAKPQAPLVVLWKLPPAAAGPREILMRIEDFTPGTGICVAGPDGKPVTVCGFVEPPAGAPPDRKGNLFMTWPPDKSPLTGGDPRQLGVSFAPRAVWLRLHAVTDFSNSLVVSWSGDGKTWARLRPTPAWTPGPVAIDAVGLFVGAHPSRAATLTHLAVAEMPGFAKILPRDLVAKVDPLLVAESDAKRFEPWKAATLANKPADVDAGRWLAAAAIRCLATTRTRLSVPLCMVAWQHCRTLEMPLADRLAVCDDIDRFLNAGAAFTSGMYGDVAGQAFDAGDLETYRTAQLRLQQAPGDIVRLHHFGQQVDPLGVQERMLRRLHVTGPAEEFHQELVRQRFYANDAGYPAALARQVAAENPVVLEVSNPVQNTTNEIFQAIVAGDFDDAQRAMAAHAATGGGAATALAQDPRDPSRFATLPALVAGWLDEQPAFREFMQGEPTERGRLRLAQLRAAGDAAGMVAATIEFQGTAAAAEAHEWLAMRAVAAGEFAAARELAHTALAAATPDVRGRLTSILAIAAALGGGDVASAPQAALAGIPPAELAAIVAAAARQTVPANSPPPGELESVNRLTLGPSKQGNPGIDYPESVGLPGFPSPPFYRTRLDWAGEVCSLSAVAGRLLASNRQEVVSLDPATGKAQWRVPAGPKPGLLVQYGLVPMRPVCDDRHAYLRRLRDGGSPTLAAIRLGDGTIAWDVASPAAGSSVARTFVSDPVLGDDALQILERAPGLMDQLVLVTIDRATGARLRERLVCGLLPTWFAPRANRSDPGDCQLTAAGGRLFVTAGGSVLCLTGGGDVLWVRRQPWSGLPGNGWWRFQTQAPPFVHDGTLFVAQPGVDAVTAIAAPDGTLRWRTPLDRLRRLVGMAGTAAAARIIVETDAGIVALDPRDGTARTILDARDGPGDGWLGIAPNRLLGPAVATADGLVIAAVHRRRPDTEKSMLLDVAIVWVDAGTGAVRHEAIVPALADKPPWVGPMAAADGRLWLLANPSPRDLQRVLWELAPKPAP